MYQCACAVTGALSSVSFTCVRIYTHGFCIYVRCLSNFRRTATHTSFSLEAGKNKGGYCIGRYVSNFW